MGLGISTYLGEYSSIPIVIHVIYQANGAYCAQAQRTIHLPSGSTISDLVEKFLKVFNDVIPSGSKTSDFRFLVYNSEKDKFIQENLDVVLKQDDKVKVVKSNLEYNPGPVVPHPIHGDELYYIWSAPTKGLLKRSSSTVKCDGTPDDHSDLIHFKAVDVSTATTTLYALTLPGSQGKVYVMKGQDENLDVVMEEMDEALLSNLPDECRFESLQFFGETQFRCYLTAATQRADLYITAMKDGTTKLQKAGEQAYPRPNTLFNVADVI